MRKIDQWYQWVMMTGIIFIHLVIAWFFFMQYYPFEVVKLHEFSVENETIVAGEAVRVLMMFEKKMDYAPIIKWSLVDGFIYGIPRDSIFRGVGENEVYTYFIIPKGTPKGTYHLQAHIEYEITPFRTINYVWKSNTFIINSPQL
jgi:hypothetical protein